MANAKLHIICGNCGSNEFLSWKYEEWDDGDGVEKEVYISCGNCWTLHDLSNNAKPE